MNKLIACSEFVKRQTPESGYSHFDGSWEELEELITEIYTCWHSDFIRMGYKDGVILVDIPVSRRWKFYTAVVSINDKTKLNINYAPRKEGEAPFLRVSAKAKKQICARASVVLYRADVLAEDNDRSTGADWEIIAIKASPTPEEEPMDPYTMARNFLHLKGGTRGDFTAQQFAESIVYWNNHCMSTAKPKWYRKIVSLFK